jgi:hypothetical protein
LIVSLPNPTWIETVLEPRKVRGISTLWKRPSAARVEIGMPLYQRIGETLEGADDATLAFIKAEKGSAFYLLHLACTFWDDDKYPFIGARFQTFLRGNGGRDDQPIAWSMFPDDLHDEVVVEDSLDLSPSLKVKGIGLSAKSSQKTKQTRKLPLVRAFGERQSNLTWKIARTTITPITGSMRFSAIIRSKKNASFKVRVAVDAEIEQEGILFFTEAKATSSKPLTITIP